MPEKIKPELLQFLQPGELSLKILVVESLCYLPDLRRMFPCAQLYAVTADNELKGVFAWWYGPHAEPTYDTVYGGRWISDEPYGVVHRIAAAEHSGAGKEAIQWAIKASNGHLKIDTHEANAAMRHVLESLGFSERGVILLNNGEPRIAYEIC